MGYTRREPAQAVLDAHPDSKRDLDIFRGGFNVAMKAHQVRRRDALLNAFGTGLMGPTFEKVTPEDLKTLGFDETPPRISDYESDY